MEAKEYEGLSASQFEALTSIAFGGDGGGFSPKTLRSLEARGLLVAYDKKLTGRGTSVLDYLPIIVKAYVMPIPEHIKFCEWWAQHE